MYVYNAKIVHVVDGDTIDVMLDLGFSIQLKQRIRLLGIDTPESRTRNLDEKKVGLYAKQVLSEWLAKASTLRIKTTLDGKGKFGRVLGEVWIDGFCANDKLVSMKLATKYTGKKKVDFNKLVKDGLIIASKDVPNV